MLGRFWYYHHPQLIEEIIHMNVAYVAEFVRCSAGSKGNVTASLALGP